MTARYCLTLDLRDDAGLIADYERHHAAIWPEVRAHLRKAGVEEMTIWRRGTRLVMLLEAGPDFSFGRMAALEQETPRVREWEALMWTYQQPLPGADGKWQLMDQLFQLNKT